MSPHVWPLVVSAGVAGLAGSLHCVLMCSALQRHAAASCSTPACRPTRPTLRPQLWFQAGRLCGYTAFGMLVAQSSEWLMAAAAGQPLMNAIWVGLLTLLTLLGLWSLIAGRLPWEALPLAWQVPAFLRLAPEGQARGTEPSKPVLQGSTERLSVIRIVRRPAGPRGWFLRGTAWSLLPCGLLWSGLALAVLAGEPIGGGMVMLAFALGTTVGLAGLGGALHRVRPMLMRFATNRFRNADPDQLATRVSGLLTAVMAGIGLWSVARGLPNPFC